MISLRHTTGTRERILSCDGCVPIHVLATYDPRTIYTGEKRDIVLEDFEGRGATLRLPADEQVRIFALDEACGGG